MSNVETSQPVAASGPVTEDDLVLQADDGAVAEGDSAYGGSDSNSDTTSVSSSIYQGVIQHGRRFQSYNVGEYHAPADERQFDAIDALHQVTVAIESGQDNPYFYSPIQPTAKNIIDLGAGTGAWAVDVADRFPNLTVHGVDLYPPPATWVPPNCILEVDDFSKPWTFSQKFDFVHLRYHLGSFDDQGWRRVYREAFENLVPGGWIEQVEVDAKVHCDDGSIPDDSPLATWGTYMYEAGKKSGKRLDIIHTMRDMIEDAGFINVSQKDRKVPSGVWARSNFLKSVGQVMYESNKAGCEGYAMVLLTQVGTPEVWSTEEVQVYLAGFRAALADKKQHGYHIIRRVWAQKPLEEGSGSQTEPAASG